MANKNNVVKFRKPIHINVGLVICSAIFIYLVIFSIISLSRDKITIYEVCEGSSANEFSTQYTGIILRSEAVKNAEKSGYISFYAGESQPVSVGGSIYAIDESGKLYDAIKEASSQNEAVINDNSGKIKNSISAFNTKFKEKNFDRLYDFKNSLTSQVVDNITSKIVDEANASGAIKLDFVKSDTSGTITHSTDGFEALTEDQITNDVFKTNYNKKTVNSNDLVEANSPIYKIITDENWSIVFPISDDAVQKYKDKTQLKIKILNDDLVAHPAFEIIKLSDGSYGKLTFDKYMVRYISDRFIDFSIYEDTVDGYKIPISSVTTKDFYVIPANFATKGGDSEDVGFNKQVYNNNGERSVEFIKPTIYKVTPEYYYVDSEFFEKGDVLVMENSDATFQISATEQLQGVYNVNAGYTEFKLVDILTQANEYYIIAKNTYYGLNNYDNIILDAQTVEEKQIVFQ